MGYHTPRLYGIMFNSGTIDPADSTAYHVGFNAGVAPGSYAASVQYAPYSGHIRIAQILIGAYTVIGTAEDWSWYLRINDTTDYLIGTVATLARVRSVLTSDLNIPIKAGDGLALKCTTPIWVTNPTGVRIGGMIHIECE